MQLSLIQLFFLTIFKKIDAPIQRPINADDRTFRALTNSKERVHV